MPAAQAGLRAGDVILEVDGQDFRKSTSDKVSAALKGTPGSKIVLLIQRPGESKPRRIEFRRQKIQGQPRALLWCHREGYGLYLPHGLPQYGCR